MPVEDGISAPDQTCPEAHPTSCTVGTRSFPGVTRPGGGVDRKPLRAPRLKKEYIYTFTPLCAFMGGYRVIIFILF